MHHRIASTKAKAQRRSAYRSQQKRRRSRRSRSRQSRKLAAGGSRRRRGSRSRSSPSGYSTNEKLAMAMTGIVGVGAAAAAFRARQAAEKLNKPLPSPPLPPQTSPSSSNAPSPSASLPKQPLEPPRQPSLSTPPSASLPTQNPYLQELRIEIVKRRAQEAELRRTHPELKTAIDIFDERISEATIFESREVTATAQDVFDVTSDLEAHFKHIQELIQLEYSTPAPVSAQVVVSPMKLPRRVTAPPPPPPVLTLEMEAAKALAQAEFDFQISNQLVDKYKAKATQLAGVNWAAQFIEKDAREAVLEMNQYLNEARNVNKKVKSSLLKPNTIELASRHILQSMDKFVRKMELFIALVNAYDLIESVKDYAPRESFKRTSTAVDLIYNTARDAIIHPRTAAQPTASSIKHIQQIAGAFKNQHTPSLVQKYLPGT